MLTGGWLAQCCYALTRLGIPDLLAGGPRPAAELAHETGADARAVRRVLSSLAAVGLFGEPAAGTFALTPVTRLLCADTPRSSRESALMFGEEVHRSFGEITHTLTTGQPAFEAVYGRPFYDHVNGDARTGGAFSAAMGTAPVPAALARCDLSGLGCLVDVGGGEGGLLTRALTPRPAARGVLVELPEALGRARPRLAEAGLERRVDLVEGSFFDQLPGGGDVYVLSRVLHNWDDARATRVLRRVREAIPPHARLLVLERLEHPGPAAPGDLGRPSPSAQAKLIDLLMLVMLEGHDRTEAEYRALLEAADFEVSAVHQAPGRAESALEAVPV
ncbi:hypothetical protein E0L36_19795 [Streptomyces sp. AJS327]|nr:hypothetical protein [Streptomyces sp. AJS327]